MEQLRKEGYTVGYDRMIYDAKHPIDGTILTVTTDGKSEITIKRGQLIDGADGKYSLHTAGGEPVAIAAEEVTVEAGNTEAAVQAYTSGSFRTETVVSSTELTNADIQKLKNKGIYLK